MADKLLPALKGMIEAYWTGSEDSDDAHAPSMVKNALAAVAEAERPTTPKERVEQELADLTEKRHRLGTFIMSPSVGLTAMEVILLTGQYPAMETYEQLLRARLAIWRDL